MANDRVGETPLNPPTASNLRGGLFIASDPRAIGVVLDNYSGKLRSRGETKQFFEFDGLRGVINHGFSLYTPKKKLKLKAIILPY